MANKGLSNGTLALKFMQNAQRSKQEGITQLKQAEVKDDAEWEVSPQIREAWGLTSKARSFDKAEMTQETSYLPFLFPSLSSHALASEDDVQQAGPSKVAGRRKFSKGKEASAVPEEVEIMPGGGRDEGMPEPDDHGKASLSERSSIGTIKKRHTKPHPLIGKGASKMAARDALGPTAEGSNSVDAFSAATPVLSMISGETSADVGIDMRKARKLMAETETLLSTNSNAFELDSRSGMGIGENSKKSSTTFVRPAGVDAPVAKANVSTARRVKKRNRDPGETAKCEVSSPPGPSSKAKKARATQQVNE